MFAIYKNKIFLKKRKIKDKRRPKKVFTEKEKDEKHKENLFELGKNKPAEYKRNYHLTHKNNYSGTF